MSVTAWLAAAILVQTAPDAVSLKAGSERDDVAYAELADGRPQAAIDRIRASRVLASDDPAALINLGAAYARLGMVAQARRAFRVAIASANRYQLELADGRWMDSRQAARLADRMLERGSPLALR